MDHQKHNLDECTLVQWFKSDSPTRHRQISKTVKKLLLNVSCNDMRKVSLKNFLIATGTSETLKKKYIKKIINKKIMSN